MRFLKTNTATRITVGPFLDKTDGITPEVALTVTSEKLTFVVDTAGVPTLVLDVAPTASGGANDMVHITNDDAGYYDLELAAANVNYLGPAFLSLNDVATHLPVFHEFMILPANIYDSLVLGTDLVDVSVTQLLGTAWLTPGTAGTPDVNVKLISDDATAANNCELFFDGTGYAGTNNVIPTVTTVTNQLTAAAVATGVWQDATAGDFTVASSVGKSLYIANIVPGAAGGHMISGSNAGTTTLAALTVTGALTTGSIVNSGVFTQTGTHTISALTVTNALTAGSNAVPWNASWDTEVQSECDDAITLNALVLDLPTTAEFNARSLVSADYTIVSDLGVVQTADHTAGIADIPTVAEFNARSLPSADYVVVGDTIAAVTAATVSAIGANVITAASMNADAGTEIAAAVWAKTGAVTSIATELLIERLYEMINNKMIVTEATGAVALRNLADGADVATGNVQDLGATTQRNALTWV